MQATPTTWRILLETGWEGNDRLRVLCGGEAFPQDLAKQLLERVAVVWNMYGPTETTIWSAIHPVETGEVPVPIGRPINNTQLYLLDRHLNPVPIGVPGDLYIGGDGLGRRDRSKVTVKSSESHIHRSPILITQPPGDAASLVCIIEGVGAVYAAI